MAGDQIEDVTALLKAWQGGSAEAAERLMAAVNRELRRLAAGYLRRERNGHTLEPTALVNEAYLRLVPQQQFGWQNRGHFLAIACREMRRILVDHARRRQAAKRDVGDERISLSDLPDPSGAEDVRILGLHEALLELAARDRRQADAIELRYFGGLTIEEIGAVTGVSPATVKRDLTLAKQWLFERLH